MSLVVLNPHEPCDEPIDEPMNKYYLTLSATEFLIRDQIWISEDGVPLSCEIGWLGVGRVVSTDYAVHSFHRDFFFDVVFCGFGLSGVTITLCLERDVTV